MTINLATVHWYSFKLSISETGTVSIMRYKERKVATQFSQPERISLDHWTPKEDLSRMNILLISNIINVCTTFNRSHCSEKQAKSVNKFNSITSVYLQNLND
jgi:hypothetical protein